VEPVLREYHNIECRDAVLEYDGREPDVDGKTGKVRSRWGGRMMRHPVTGDEVPDPTDQVVIYRYVNARSAVWQEADYIVSNPPFQGKLYMLSRLGEGYIEALREAYQGDVHDGADFVMYWWQKAAKLLAENNLQRFGFITTNSISQTVNRKTLQNSLNAKSPIHLMFVIPEHPWVDTENAAAVRIAMTAAAAGEGSGTLAKVVSEKASSGDGTEVELTLFKGKIYADLRIGAEITSAISLSSNALLAGTGLILGNRGFVLTKEEALELKKDEPADRPLIFDLKTGKDLADKSRNVFVIDTNGWSEDELASQVPSIHQHLLERVYPERQTNRDVRLQRYWWLFRRSNEQVRQAIKQLERYIVTPETVKHRVFSFLAQDVKPEHGLIVIGSDDAFILGVLSSRIHVLWALAAGGDLGGVTPRYNKTVESVK
jgi:hypothetical protein